MVLHWHWGWLVDKQLSDGMRSGNFCIEDLEFHSDVRLYVYYDVDDGFSIRCEGTTAKLDIGLKIGE